jgi:type IV pilus assembly protein PilF
VTPFRKAGVTSNSTPQLTRPAWPAAPPVQVSGWRRAAAPALAVLVAACASPGTPPAPPPEPPPLQAQPDADRSSRVRLELASAYFERGQNEVALSEVRAALAANPNLGEAHYLNGLIYANMGEARLAEDSFRRALQINPRDADAMHNFGWFLCQQRRYAEADEQFERARAQPQYRDITRSLLAQGVCQARDGRLDQAERSLSRSYELDPANPTTAVNLSQVLYQRGEMERARFYIRRVNAVADLSNAETLWLAARIENRMGNRDGTLDLGRQLRNRFPQSPQALAFERGQFDD